MLRKIRGFHIEPTNMCTLKCPQCARTDFINHYGQDKWPNVNINLEHLKSFFDIDLTAKIIKLCGNYGDPIYYPDLLPLIEYFKSKGAYIDLYTNGSYKAIEFWNELDQLFDSNDQITFCIDGMPNNFVEYRINGDWDTIAEGIDIMTKNPCKTIWQFIPFKFNEHQVDQVKELAISLGFDEFFVLESSRWEPHTEYLRPSKVNDQSWHNIQWKDNPDKAVTINPKCMNHKEHYISASGHYSPCCWAGDHRFYYKSEFFKNQDSYDISKTTISAILKSNQSMSFYNILEDAKLNYCTYNCPKL